MAAAILRIDELMTEKGVTALEVAVAIHTSESNFSRIRNGKMKAIRFSTIAGLCSYFDCEPGDLIKIVSDEEACALYGDDYLKDTPS